MEMIIIQKQSQQQQISWQIIDIDNSRTKHGQTKEKGKQNEDDDQKYNNK